MSSNWSFAVTHVTSSTTITSYVIDISQWTDIGSGEIPSAILTLSAKNGQFLTQSFSGNTPIIARWDKIKMSVTDVNGVTFSKIFIVDKILPLYDVTQGDRAEIHLLGLEWWTQRINFAKQYYFADAFSVISDIAARYNVQAGSNQPQIYQAGNVTYNQLPQWTANNYDFNFAETTVYDGLLNVIDKLGNSVSGGGAGDYFELKFFDGDLVGDPTSSSKITLKAWSSGSTPSLWSSSTLYQSNDMVYYPSIGSSVYRSNINNNLNNIPPTNWILVFSNSDKIIISGNSQGTLAINMPKGEGGIEAPLGTNVISWGANDQGSLPTDFSRWRSYDEAFHEFPSYNSSLVYPTNAYVTGSDGNVYQAKSSVPVSTPPPNATYWNAISEAAYIGALNYSPWTNSRVTETINSGADMRNSHWTSQASPLLVGATFDSNLVVQDGTYYRTYADVRTPDLSTVPAGSLLSTKKIYNGSASVFYRGFRVLVDVTLGALGGVFTQNGSKDRFGNNYANSLVQNNGNNFGDYRDWDVLINQYSPAFGFAIPVAAKYQVAVRDEAKNFIWTLGVPSWADNSNGAKAQDCFHPYNAIGNTTGTASVSSYASNSAIYLQYQFSAADVLSGIVTTTKNYYSIGAWYNITFPYSNTEDFLPAHSVGTLYGGEGHNPPEPCTIDSINMHLTHSGNTGFNQADSIDLGPLSALAFQINFLVARTGAPTTPISILNLAGSGVGTFANFKFRCAIYDYNDNVVTQDFVVQFNNLWQDIQLPLSSFQIYRARIPPTFGDINTILQPPQLNILNVFQWKNIKQIVIQWQDVYDDQGRFKPEGCTMVWQMIASAASVTDSPSLRIQIDSLRFVKPLMATSGNVSDWDVEPLALQRQNIANYLQLQNDAITQMQILKFQHKEFEITTTGRCDILFGDTFYFSDPYLVNESDNGANTIKLVAKRIEYNINKTAIGPGGLTRKILGVKRFTS